MSLNLFPKGVAMYFFAILVSLLILVFLIFVLFKDSDIRIMKKQGTDHGTYIPWQPMVYTYKEYKGTPGIDDPEFEAFAKQRNVKTVYVTAYTHISDDELEKIINSRRVDSDAVYEKFLRLIKDKTYDVVSLRHTEIYSYLNKAAEMGHIQANMTKILYEVNAWNYFIKKRQLKKYEAFTPVALSVKITIMMEHEPNSKSIYTEAMKLKSAGNYDGIVTAFLMQLRVKGYVDKEIFCELYYRGYEFYEMKQKANIKCGE